MPGPFLFFKLAVEPPNLVLGFCCFVLFLWLMVLPRGQCRNGPTWRKPQSLRFFYFIGSTMALRRYFTARPQVAAKGCS